ncbi:hypothetical protein HF521_015636, partial [Silurus meridionalis]
YSLRNRTLVASCGWNESALLSIYRLGLNPELKQAMAVHEDSVGLESFIQKSIGLSQRLAACHPNQLQPECLRGATAPPDPEPMQLDSQRLSHEREKTPSGHGEVPLTVSLLTTTLSFSVHALVDSGSAGNFNSQACLDRLCLPRDRGSQDLALQTIQGRLLGKGWVKYCTPVVTLQVGLFHREEIWFLVLRIPQSA